MEAFVIDAPKDYDVYGLTADLDFVDHIRGMQRFDSIDDLITTMAVDVDRSRQILSA